MSQNLKKQQIQLKKLNYLLPLVAIGTVADCQSVLENTNRLLIKAGLSLFENTPITGLSLLLDQTKLAKNYTINEKLLLSSSELGFYLSPILNASGRISHAELSIRVLLPETFKSNNFTNLNKEFDTNNLKDLVAELVETNIKRKEMVKNILETLEIINNPDEAIIWVEGDLNKGIVGLLASRIVNIYDKPVFIVDTSSLTGSARSPEGFHIPEALKKCNPKYFEKFGGHPQAAGFTASSLENLVFIKQELNENIHTQKDQFTNQEKPSFKPESLEIPSEWQDLEYKKEIIWLTENEITVELLTEIFSLDPFGQDFPMPLLAFCIDKPEINFLANKHIQIFVNKDIKTILFNPDDDLLPLGKKNWILAKPNKNIWNNKISYQLIIEKILKIED
jgi:single-stranded-DNA-specific exonuclease